MTFIIDIQDGDEQLIGQLIPFLGLLNWHLPAQHQQATYNLDAQLQKLQPAEQSRLACLFHALAHFGQATPLKHGIERNDYFQILSAASARLGKDILKPFVWNREDVNFLISGNKRNLTLELGPWGAGYTSVIPLTADAADRYFTPGQNQISQFQFQLQDITNAINPCEDIHLYLQAVAHSIALCEDPAYAGSRAYYSQSKQASHKIFDKVLLQMGKAISDFLPQSWLAPKEGEPSPQVWLYFEVYNQQFIGRCLQNFAVASDALQTQTSKDGNPIHRYLLDPTGRLANFVKLAAKRR